MDELTVLRAEIDALDRALVDLLAERRDVVRRIAAHKHRAGLPGVDPARETALRAAMIAHGEKRDVPAALVTGVLDAVLRDSRPLVESPP